MIRRKLCLIIKRLNNLTQNSITNASFPHTVNNSGKHVSDGVDVAIEVKPDIANFHELQRRLVQGIKKLRRRVNTLIYENSKPEYIRNHSKQVPFFIFSIKAKSNIADTIREIKTYYEENDVPIFEQIDCIVVLNKGIKYEELYPWISTYTDEQKAGRFFEEWDDNTLRDFFCIWICPMELQLI
ncbi:hypothetical protein SC499_20970 [Peribacillus simplex]|uniref:hypothetical protein n=1 Tax=Peribacillus simplex TaxID=1478 RepID=UPI00298DB272|nr:hypothetical protein [Peribacillus simplex]MDW7617090.1 hypothetical protein [Peribacillus simplex]